MNDSHTKWTSSRGPATACLGLFGFGMVPSLQYRVVSLAGASGALAQSLPASAANVGIAFGSFAGGVAIGSFTASAAVVSGLIIAVVAIPVAWVISFLRPPAVRIRVARTTAGSLLLRE